MNKNKRLYNYTEIEKEKEGMLKVTSNLMLSFINNEDIIELTGFIKIFEDEPAYEYEIYSKKKNDNNDLEYTLKLIVK